MSNDATFDMIQAGHKVRALNTAQFYEYGTRGLSGRNENMKMTQAELNKLAQDLAADTARLRARVAQEERRVSALEHGGNRAGDDLPIFYVPVDKMTGNIGGGPRDYCPVPIKGKRELENDADLPLPEYYVPVNRTAGTVGEDR
jgi:hypothetical protein